jgi:GntR family transcriptional regulator
MQLSEAAAAQDFQNNSLLTADYFRDTFRFSPSGKEPLYAQLESYLKMQIRSGVLKSGDRLITETELCDILKVSRSTVRGAMNRLVEDGLLLRRRGKGSFVAEGRMQRNINYLYTFTENIRSTGAVPSSIVRKCAVIEADEFLRDRLALPQANGKVFYLSRIRCADGEPILFEDTYIPYFLCGGIEKIDFAEHSLYETLRGEYGLNICHAEETIEAIIIKGEIKKILQCKTNSPGYKINRLSYLDNEYIFEYTTSVTRSDKCVFKLDLSNSAKSPRHAVDFQRQLQI